MHRHHGGGTGTLHGQRRAGQVELERRPGRDEVLVGRDDRGKGLQDLRIVLDLPEDVARHAGPGEDTDRPRTIPDLEAGVLQRLPGAFEKDPMLRVGHLGFARVEAEETRVEEVDVGQCAVGPDHVRDLVGEGWRRRVLLHGPQRLLALSKDVPQFIDRSGSGKAAGHPDDGDFVSARHGFYPRRVARRLAGCTGLTETSSRAPRMRRCSARRLAGRAARATRARGCGGGVSDDSCLRASEAQVAGQILEVFVVVKIGDRDYDSETALEIGLQFYNLE